MITEANTESCADEAYLNLQYKIILMIQFLVTQIRSQSADQQEETRTSHPSPPDLCPENKSNNG